METVIVWLLIGIIVVFGTPLAIALWSMCLNYVKTNKKSKDKIEGYNKAVGK